MVMHGGGDPRSCVDAAGLIRKRTRRVGIYDTEQLVETRASRTDCSRRVGVNVVAR